VRRGNRTSDPHALGDLRLVEARSDVQGCDRVREGRGHSGFFRGLSCSYAVALGKAARLPGISIPDSSRRAPESAKWISQDLTKWFERVRKGSKGFSQKERNCFVFKGAILVRGWFTE